ncbi:MAG: HAD-IA family hydrolase [Opitutaceae bacterium]|nr:HAD-IA family hydrolase [Opitutaceae bacterium]
MPAVLLDFDGLILQTEASGFASLQALFAARGATYTLTDYLQIVGTSSGVLDPFLLLEQRTGRTWDRSAFDAERTAHEARLNEPLAPLPGVLDLLDAASACGCALAVVSSSPHGWVDGHLHRLGLFGRFTTIVARGDAPQVKPAPDLYFEALRRLEVTANEAVAFEDSYNGSLAAKRAGLRCVAVPHALTRSQDFSHCDLVVDSLASIDLAALTQRLA